MAVDTEKTLRNQVLYSIYVRNYSEAGTFAAVQADLDRIKALGTEKYTVTVTQTGGEGITSASGSYSAKSTARARSAAPTPSATTAP